MSLTVLECSCFLQSFCQYIQYFSSCSISKYKKNPLLLYFILHFYSTATEQKLPPKKNVDLLVCILPVSQVSSRTKHEKGAIYLPKVYYLNGFNQRSINFFFKPPDSKHFWLGGHMVSVSTTQLRPCGMKISIDNTKTNECVNRTLFIKN